MIDFAVVGGGVIGWSTAWHLAKMAQGATITVFERDFGAARCASNRGAGGARSQWLSPIHVQMSLHSLGAFANFAAEVGGDIEFRQNGYVFVARDDDAAKRLFANVQTQRSHGASVREVSIIQLAAWSPAADFSDIKYACIGSNDGYLTGPLVRKCYRDAALKLGVREVEGVEVLDFTLERLSTTAGTVECKLVILAGGHESHILASKLGIDLPIQPELHWLASFPNYAFRAKDAPMIVDFGTTFHFRPYGGGILVGYDAPSPSASAASHLSMLFDVSQHILPTLEAHSMDVEVWSGYYGVTPDHHGILSRDRDVVIATGFCGHGVMHSPSAGLAAAELALYGESRTIDVAALSHERFSKGQLLEEPMIL